MERPKVKTLYIGLTDFCNLTCIMCPQSGDRMRRKRKGFAGIDLIRKVFGSIPSVCDTELHVFLMWLGESTLHPDFEEIINIVRSAEDGISKLVIYTNGTQVDMLKLLCSMLNIPVQVIISLDAIRENTYRRIKGANCYRDVEANAMDLIRSCSPLKRVEISLQFLVMPENVDEILDFRDTWSDFFRGCNIPFGVVSDYNLEEYGRNNINLVFRRVTIEDMNLSNEIYRAALDSLGLRPHERYVSRREDDSPGPTPVCPAPFRNLTVDWNGHATFCCYDSFVELDLGNLYTDSLDSVWWGEKAESIRRAMFRNDLANQPSICRNCMGFDAVHLTSDELKVLGSIYGK